MKIKITRLFFVILAVLLLSGAAVAIVQGAAPKKAEEMQNPAPLVPGDLTPTDFITVTSTSDDGGLTERCDTASPCTLRRAINQVRWYSAVDKVFHIAFDIDTGDSGYDSAHRVWVIEVDSDNSGFESFAFREFGTYGKVIIDGTSQPIGRDLSVGPRIILRGDNDKGAFNLTGGNNVIRGLGFQGFGNQMVYIPATNQNLIEGNHFGLTITGTEQYLRNTQFPADGSGETGIFAQKSGDNGISNTLQNNILLGFKSSAINVQGDYNAILSNTVGTRADGTVPEVRSERKCRPNARYYNWFAGAGVKVFGTGNEVAYNRIVGMLFPSNDPLNTPDDALSVTGRDHFVHHNTIGVTSDDRPFGVCGEGIHVGGISGAHFIKVLSNTVVGAQGVAGIFVTAGETGYDLDAVTVQGNVILDSKIEAFDFGDIVPEVLRLFNPAAVTEIVTTTDSTFVTGTSGLNSLCEDCIVEVFLDQIDTVTETLESLGKTTADGSGNWTLSLSRTLALTEGLRTASTTVADAQIEDLDEGISYSAGTTTKISGIYTQTGAPVPVEPPDPEPSSPLPIITPTYLPQPEAPTSFNTIITVDSAADPDDSADYTCVRDLFGPPEPAPDGLCTLRRAIVEATALAAEDPSARPIAIEFDIPTADPQYDPGLGVWVIQITDTLNTDALPTLGSTDISKSGYVVIDGDTQTGGRTDAPKIIIRGPRNRELAGHGLVVNGNHNVIRNLAFQDLRMVLQLNHSANIVENNVFGLSIDGQTIYLKNEDAPEDGSGQSGIKVADNTTSTLIQNNVLAGYRGAAIDVEGDDSYILNNYVGTRIDGTVPEVTYNRWCRPNARYENWFGGAGVETRGHRNQVIGNRIVGLLWYSADPTNTPDDALSVVGQDHLIQGNVIGIGTDGVQAGSCGRGIVVDARYTRVFSNTVVRTALEGVRINGSEKTMNALYLRGNQAWDGPPQLLEFGVNVPEARSIFTPAHITTIAGTLVSGASGQLAPCPYCQVELFLDDLDEVTETMRTLAVTTADKNGKWSTTLTQALAMDEGIRTASTILNYGIMENFDFPSTSRFSEVYSQTGSTPPAPPPEPDPVEPPDIPTPVYLAPPNAPLTYTTIITVTTTDDTSTSESCADTTPDNCSLRRAINQVEDLLASERPALIAFDIPDTDVGYNAAGYWKITLSSTALPPVKGGHVSIDGDTQPEGRSTGPRIILFRNSSTGARLTLGETQYEGNHVLRGLGFQGVEVHMSGDDNIISNNQLGYNDDGTAIYLYNNDPAQSNHAIIQGASTSDHNHIHHNALAGSSTNAINLQSDDNLVEENYIGTLPNGTIPVDSIAPDDICVHTQLTGNWYGGGGIYLGGKRNRVISNTIAGLMLYGSAMQTQPPAIELIFGQDSLVAYNRIGVDALGTQAWTCGPGIDNTDASFTRILSNTIINGYQQGIFVDGTIIVINATTMQGNIISGTIPAIEFGQSVPEALSLFSPALVTRIDGVDVTGISDDPCPYCDVDIFVDDDDATTEALVYVGTAQADANGDWSIQLPSTLEDHLGLRTLSTARTYGVIPFFEAGTSSNLSSLFVPQPLTKPQLVTITGPALSVLRPDELYEFVASVSPISTTLPITYTWEATDRTTQVVRGGIQNDITFSWSLTGTKHITVTVDNGLGSITGNYSVEVQDEVNYKLYLPLTLRQ